MLQEISKFSDGEEMTRIGNILGCIVVTNFAAQLEQSIVCEHATKFLQETHWVPVSFECACDKHESLRSIRERKFREILHAANEVRRASEDRARCRTRAAFALHRDASHTMLRERSREKSNTTSDDAWLGTRL